MKKAKKANKITKESLEIKKTDNEFYDNILKKVTEYDEDSWKLTVGDGAMISCIKNGSFIPKAGMTVRFYGKGFGYTVRGIEIDGHIMYYRTPAQEEERHKKWCEDQDKERKLAFKKNKKNLDKDYNNLPDLFKKRIDKFRKNNSDFRWKYEGYEMFCCKEAVKIASTLKTVENIPLTDISENLEFIVKLQPVIVNKLYDEYEKLKIEEQAIKLCSLEENIDVNFLPTMKRKSKKIYFNTIKKYIERVINE